MPVRYTIANDTGRKGGKSTSSRKGKAKARNPPVEPAKEASSDDELHEDVTTQSPRDRRPYKFINSSIPGFPATEGKWNNIVIPRWMLYISSVDNPWVLANSAHVEKVQNIWDETFPNVEHEVALRREPVFQLVSPC